MRCLKRIIFALLTVFIGAFITFIIVASRNYVVPVLMYHSVCPEAAYENRLNITTATFEKQMRFLKERHYNVVRVEELAALISAKKKIPPKTIAITFDDGYRDNYIYALPILMKYAIPAAVFVIVDEVGRSTGDKLTDKLTWEEIKEMQDSGVFTIGSHAMGAERLVNIKSREELNRQISGSKEILEEKLGKKVNVFSYPEGAFDPEVRQLVIDAGYRAAVATNPGRDYPNDDTFALKRLRISENAAELFVFWVETSGLYTFMKEWKD